MPTAWGPLGISYDSGAISAPKAPEFTGKITVIDDPSTVFDLASPILGYTESELTHLERVVAQAKQLSPSFGDMANLLASREVVAGWGGFSSVNAYASEAGSNAIKTQIELEDGSASFTECYAGPEDNRNPATAYSMINSLLDPATNAEVANLLIPAPTVEAAWPKVDATVKPLFPQGQQTIEAFLEKVPLTIDAPEQSTEFVNFGELTQAWNEIKVRA